MSWKELVGAYRSLVAAVESGESIEPAWESYKSIVAQCEANDRPYHLRGLIRQIETYAGDRDPADVAILDHGCGGGLTLLYLMVLGFTNVYGVDVDDSPCERWNRLMAEIMRRPDKRFFVYSGEELPIRTGTIDIVFSQEVLEHVHPDVLESYYAEEGRVLKPGGLALHSVPHRLVPYDSHTRPGSFTGSCRARRGSDC